MSATPKISAPQSGFLKKEFFFPILARIEKQANEQSLAHKSGFWHRFEQ
jgi:hypothetical protein